LPILAILIGDFHNKIGTSETRADDVLRSACGGNPDNEQTLEQELAASGDLPRYGSCATRKRMTLGVTKWPRLWRPLSIRGWQRSRTSEQREGLRWW
jgi:hypothetical protein